MELRDSMWTIVDQIGHRFMKGVHYTFDIFLMTYLSFRVTLTRPSQGFRAILSVIFSQVYFTGYQALPLISGLAVAVSGLVVLQSTSQFNLLGGGGLIGQLMVIMVVREIAPLLTALIVIARSGTAVASELGTMRVNREIDALEVMGINPLSYIIFPRLVGGMLSVICLALYFMYVSILSGFLLAKLFLNMPLSFYIETIMQVLSREDVLLFACKNLFGGAIVFTICCYQGLQVRQGPHEIPQVTTVAVVKSIIYVVCFNLLATAIFYLNQLSQMGLW